MALESADIANLLRKVRSASVAAAEVPTIDPAELEPAPKPIAPRTVAVQPEESDLADLHAELRADEVLIERILGLLYRAKKRNPNGGAVSILDMEKQLGIEREGAAFVMAYMKSTKVVEMDDKSRLSITVPGIDYLRRSLGIDTMATHAVEE